MNLRGIVGARRRRVAERSGAMEPKGATPESPWRDVMAAGFSQGMNGRAGKSTVQKRKIL